MSTYKQRKNASYLLATNSGFSFRVKIPVDLRPIFRKKEMRLALSSSNLTIARGMCSWLGACMVRFFGDLRREDMALTPKEIAELVREYARNELRRWEDSRLLPRKLTGAEVKSELMTLEQEVSRRRDELILNDLPKVNAVANQLLSDNAITEIEDIDLLRVKRELLIAQVKIIEAKMNRLNGEYPSYGLNHPQSIYGLPDNGSPALESFDSLVSVALPPLSQGWAG